MTGKPLPTGPAWMVHVFTASGVVVAFLAVEAVYRGDLREALLWLLLGLAVDGIDGTLARAIRTKERLPQIDGAALDLVIDYLTYVFIPALILWRLDLWPPPLGLALVAAVLISSLYVFARSDMKTDDGYFRGFPALWNVVAFYFVVSPPAATAAAITVGALVILTFAPVHMVHPFRVRDYGRWLPAVALLWAAASAALLLPLDDGARPILLGVSLATAAAMAALSLMRTVRGRKVQATGSTGAVARASTHASASSRSDGSNVL